MCEKDKAFFFLFIYYSSTKLTISTKKFILCLVAMSIVIHPIQTLLLQPYYYMGPSCMKIYEHQSLHVTDDLQI